MTDTKVPTVGDYIKELQKLAPNMPLVRFNGFYQAQYIKSIEDMSDRLRTYKFVKSDSYFSDLILHDEDVDLIEDGQDILEALAI